MSEMRWYDWTAFVLLVIGGINWGLIGIANFNLVTWLLGSRIAVIKLIYILVGISAIYAPFSIRKAAD